MSLERFDERSPANVYAEIVDADTTTYVIASPNDASTRRFDSILVSSDDTVDALVRLSIDTGTYKLPLGYASIPAGSGHGGVPSVDLITVLVNAAVAAIIVGPFENVVVNVAATVSAGKTLQFALLGGVL